MTENLFPTRRYITTMDGVQGSSRRYGGRDEAMRETRKLSNEDPKTLYVLNVMDDGDLVGTINFRNGYQNDSEGDIR